LLSQKLFPHDEEVACSNNTVTNEEGVEVYAEVNLKNAPEEVAGLMPQWAICLVAAAAVVLFCGCILWLSRRQEVKRQPRYETQTDKVDANGVQ